jgi:hypothetical protein
MTGRDGYCATSAVGYDAPGRIEIVPRDGEVYAARTDGIGGEEHLSWMGVQ